MGASPSKNSHSPCKKCAQTVVLERKRGLKRIDSIYDSSCSWCVSGHLVLFERNFCENTVSKCCSCKMRISDVSHAD